MRHLISCSSVVAALVALAGCGRRCDVPALEAIATTLESGDPEARMAAVDELAQACPSMPPEIHGRLRASYGSMPADQAAMMAMGMSNKGAWADARRSACRASDEDLEAAMAVATNRSAAVYDACRFERFGLLEADETFSFGDLEAFVLYSWLRSRWTPHALARRVSRTLFTATGPLDQVVSRCVDTDEGCDGVFARLGIAPPELSLDMESAAEKVLIVVIAEPAADLRSDRVFGIAPKELPTGDGHDHTVAALRDWLDGREALEEHRLVLFADAELDFHGVLDLLQTAGQFGVLDLGLLGPDASGTGHHEMSAVSPLTWQRSLDPGDITGGPRPTTLRFSADALRIEGGEQEATTLTLEGDCAVEGCVDVNAAAADVAARSKGHDALFFELRAATGVSLGNVTALAAAVFGDHCRALNVPEGIDVGPRCRFPRVRLNGDPPVSWRTAMLDTLELGDATVERRSEQHTRGPSPEDLRARYEAARKELEACVVADEWLTGAVSDGRSLMVLVAEDERDETEAAVFANEMAPPEMNPWASEALTSCMSSALKLKVADTSAGHSKFYTERYQSHLTIPLKFGSPSQ